MKNFLSHTPFLSLATLLTATLLTLTGGCGDDSTANPRGAVDGGNPYADGSMPTDAPCAAELTYFDESVWQPILSLSCIGCHTEEGTAGASNFVLRQVTTDADLLENYHAAARMAFETSAGESVLLLRPTNTFHEGHPGGELFEVGSDPYEALAEFVLQATSGGCDEDGGIPACDAPVPGRRMLRRLSHLEYTNTVRDLLGITSDAANSFAPDEWVHGFDNESNALTVGPLLADQFWCSAASLAEEAMRTPASIVPACDAGWTEEMCAENFVTVFGERAFRRPLTSDDVSRFMNVYRIGAQDADFNSGVQWMLSAMLQSPSFLYRREIGTWDEGRALFILNDHEIASELSYLILASMPDAALFAAASAGELNTATQILAQAERLMALPGSRSNIRHFVERWLDLDRLRTVPKDAATFMEFDDATRQSMQGEIDRFVDDVIDNGAGTLQALLTTSHSFVDDRLATLYGVTPEGEADAEGYRRVELASEGRRGITTLGGYLATHARPNSSSPVERGLVVRERLFCQELPPPPPGIVAEPPDPDPESTTRERYSLHSSTEPCVSCHRLVDPIGFAYEHFDGIGRWRMDDMGHPIDTTGNIVGTTSTNTTFDGTVELSDVLSMSQDVDDCFTLQWFRYGYGLSENSRLSCMIDELAESARGGSLTIPQMIIALTQTPHFTTRESETAATPTPMPMDDGGVPDAGPADAAPMLDAGMGMTGPPEGLEVTRSSDTDWGAGYCDSVQVQNTGSSAVTWEITLTIEGMFQAGSPWEAVASAPGGEVRFSGLPHNASLAAGASVSFGFCAVR